MAACMSSLLAFMRGIQRSTVACDELLSARQMPIFPELKNDYQIIANIGPE